MKYRGRRKNQNWSISTVFLVTERYVNFTVALNVAHLFQEGFLKLQNILRVEWCVYLGVKKLKFPSLNKYLYCFVTINQYPSAIIHYFVSGYPKLQTTCLPKQIPPFVLPAAPAVALIIMVTRLTIFELSFKSDILHSKYAFVTQLYYLAVITFKIFLT
jgi:hypothetical protein